MQMQLKLSATGNNHLELTITFLQHLKQSRTRKINPQVRRGLTTASNTEQNNQEQYQIFHNHANIARAILTWQDSSGKGHNQLAGSK